MNCKVRGTSGPSERGCVPKYYSQRTIRMCVYQEGVQILIHVSPEEKEALEAAAARAGETVGSWVLTTAARVARRTGGTPEHCSMAFSAWVRDLALARAGASELLRHLQAAAEMDGGV